MANNVVLTEIETQFEWTLTNFFHSWRPVENSMELKFPQRTRWEVEIMPLNREFRFRSFVLTVKYDNTSEPREVTAERFEIVTYLNDKKVNRNLIFDYPFNAETRYLHSFVVEIDDYEEHDQNDLVIMIRIDLKSVEIDAARAGRNGQRVPVLHGGGTHDMTQLVVGMKRSRDLRLYCTMVMTSSDDERYHVLHCILQVRWNNLFRIHNLTEDSISVNIDISSKVLKFILDYMHAGQFPSDTENWSNAEFTTEFFQVIFRYQIFHMYEALRQDHENISGVSIYNVDIRRISIALQYVEDTLLRRQSMTFPVYVYPHTVDPPECGVHAFRFSVHKTVENRAGPWLSFSVLSRTEAQFVVHVDLRFSEDVGLTRLIHSSDYTIPGNGRVTSGPILFLGCPGTIRHTLNRGGTDIYKKLLFGLTFRNCASSISIWHLSSSEEFTRDTVETFSRHMRHVLNRQFRADLLVGTYDSPSATSPASHRIHKAIFKARAPLWFNAVAPPFRRGAFFRDTVSLPLSRGSFYLVSLYMYTGKTYGIHPSMRNEIRHFTSRTGLLSLTRLVENMV